MKIKIKKNDIVIVTTGNSKGTKGKVIKVFPKENRAMVEGINKVKKHERPTQDNPQGGIIEKEMSINMSNLMVLHKGSPVKIGFKISKNGKKIRINRKNGDSID